MTVTHGEYSGAWRAQTVLCTTCIRYKPAPKATITLDDIPKLHRCQCPEPIPIPTVESVEPIDTDQDVFCQSCSDEARHDVFHSPPVCPEK
jgi:hypothetical protein